jgi:hypothetical protein
MTYKSKEERKGKDRELYHVNPEPAKVKARKQLHPNPGKQQQYYQLLREFLQQQKMGWSYVR